MKIKIDVIKISDIIYRFKNKIEFTRIYKNDFIWE